MKIVFAHYAVLPVRTYGGIERILFWHMVELARLGHRVVLIGNPESQVKEFGIELIAMKNEGRDHEWFKQIPSNADIIHMSHNLKIPGDIPTIITIHGNGQVGEVFDHNTVFVSKKHAYIHGSDQFVYNCIDLNEYPFIPKAKNLNQKKWDQFLFLAKASWRVKNLKDAVFVCRKTKKHLHIAGGRWWGISRFIHSHGMVGGEEKLDLLRKMDCLLFPVRWHEPFGIAVIEAMSQGIPVIGSPYGSLPELITHETGLIANNLQELQNFVHDNSYARFDPQVIRQYVEKNFNINRHATEYLKLYQKVISGEKLNANAPTNQLGIRPENLLPF